MNFSFKKQKKLPQFDKAAFNFMNFLITEQEFQQELELLL
jgi:hypothetical protein